MKGFFFVSGLLLVWMYMYEMELYRKPVKLQAGYHLSHENSDTHATKTNEFYNWQLNFTRMVFDIPSASGCSGIPAGKPARLKQKYMDFIIFVK